MKKLASSVLALVLILSCLAILAACNTGKDTSDTKTTPKSTGVTTIETDTNGNIVTGPPTSDVTTSLATVPSEYHEGFTKSDYTVSYSNSDTKITLNGASANISGSGASVSGGIITITAKGTYVITGTLDNGQLRVKLPSSDKVHIVLLDAHIKSSSSAPIYIESTDKCTLTLVGSNTLEDAVAYTFPDGGDKPNACLYAHADLTINGTGSLTVKAHYNNGIGTSKDLKIVSGNISVTESANNGLKGNNSIYIIGGEINIKSSGDGVKTDDERPDKEDGKIYGHLTMDGGKLEIDANGNGIEVVGGLRLSSGDIKIKSGSSGININKNGLGGKHGFVMSGGTVTIDSDTNGIKSSVDRVTVTAGLMTIKAVKEKLKVLSYSIAPGCLK